MNELPEEFDGVFRFTNFTDDEFVTRWNNVEYKFPPLSTTALIIPGETPENTQNIRKKFARDLATKVFYGSKEFQKMNDVPVGGTPALYTESDLAPYVQRCLEPLPVGKLSTRKLEKDKDERYSSKVLNYDPKTGAGESLTGQGAPITD